jgi:hypothetical protein
MDEHNRSLPGSDAATDEPAEPTRSDAFAGDDRSEEVAERTATDERPLFSTTDEIDPGVTALEESRDDLALRGVAVSGALGGNAGTAAGALAGHGAALGVNAEAGQPVELEDEARSDRAPGD